MKTSYLSLGSYSSGGEVVCKDEDVILRVFGSYPSGGEVVCESEDIILRHLGHTRAVRRVVCKGEDIILRVYLILRKSLDHRIYE